MPPGDRYDVGDITTLETVMVVALEWIEQHCVVPDRFDVGNPFILGEWQAWYFGNFYLVKPGVKLEVNGRAVPALGAAAFVYRRAQVVMPQKALALDTPLPTPTGWTTMSEVQPGDVLLDAGGAPTKVVAKTLVFHEPSYRVRFSDGAEVVAGPDHEWLVDRRQGKGTALSERWSTAAMVEHGLVDSGGARRFRVAMAQPLDLPEADLPIDPYTLGAWLGDGGQHDGRITGLDEGVFARVEDAGYVVRQDAKIPKRRTVLGLYADLRQAGLLRNKHVPQVYLRASAAQRWALLQGLMDTDGHASARRGACEFTTVTPALRDAVVELAHSLGLRPRVYEGRAILRGRVTGPKWRVNFPARRDQPVFGLARKQERLLPAGDPHAQSAHRRIVSIESAGEAATQCVTVDAASHTFLAGREMVPTGNCGKGPMTAAHVCLEGVGPALFCGWARGGEVYRCSDWGCGCGWTYHYDVGEPMGRPWPTPLIQITAYSQEQTDNVYGALRPMIERGPLADVIPRTGEEFIRLPGGGRIDTVTSSQQSRLGQRVTFCPQDETGIWTPQNKMTEVAKTQRRGVAGMGGRSAETTNAWDPAQNSVAQATAKAALTRPDIFRLHRQAPPKADGLPLSYRDKRERARIHRYVYAGSPWVNLADIEAEASELLLEDPANAERFFGNRVVAGLGAWMLDGLWERTEDPMRLVAEGAEVAGGFDGSETDDWTAIRLETRDGFRFTPRYGPNRRPTYWNPAEWPGHRIPRGEVHAAMSEITRRYKLRRFYADPPQWRSEIGDWALLYGEDVVFEWATYRVVPMHDALERARVDLITGASTHDDDPVAADHVANARMAAKPSDRYLLAKPSQSDKIDLAMADTLAHEAASDLRADGWPEEPSRRVIVFR